MKSNWASFFVLLYLLAMLRPVLPVIEYIIDKDYIAEFLCINQDNTELQCQGKCYLMQKLSQQNNKKENFPKIMMEKYPIGFVNVLSISISKEKIQSTITFNDYMNQYSYIYSDTCFHPPNFCS